jgi:hypothetical protein
MAADIGQIAQLLDATLDPTEHRKGTYFTRCLSHLIVAPRFWKLINNHHQQPRTPSSKRLPSLSTLSVFSTLSARTLYRQRPDSPLPWPSRTLSEQTMWCVLSVDRPSLRILNHQFYIGRGRQLQATSK